MVFVDAPIQPERTTRSSRGVRNIERTCKFGKLPGTLFSVRAKSMIYSQTEAAETFYQVVKGVVRVYHLTVDGRRQVLGFYFPGDLFGYDTSESHQFSAEAVVNTRLRAFKRSAIASRAQNDREISRNLWAYAGQEIYRANRHVLLLSKNSEERVASFLLEMAERIQSDEIIDLPMSRQDIADYLGLTIETVSRVLTRLERISTIKFLSNRSVVLSNRKALMELGLD